MTRVVGSWMEGPAQEVCEMLIRAGYQAHFVGGCVRNALLGVPVADVDIATDARPEVVSNLAERAGFHAVPTGIEHGTVTVAAKGSAFEITTWRRDIETDGRRAVVAFADRLEEDARRRDFTMNALYATPEGDLVDPLGGLADLRARHVRFIDDAEARIREDYLRILRFFRFHAWYGDPEAGMDPEALAAIATLAEGIAGLSRERVGAELLKLLAAPDPAPSVAVMERCGVLAHALSGAVAHVLPILVHFEAQLGLAPDPVRRLAALRGDAPETALRLSRAEARKLAVLKQWSGTMDRPETLGYRLGVEDALDVIALTSASLGSDIPPNAATGVAHGAHQELPVKAKDLMPGLEGPALGAALRELEQRWIASGFTLTREELLK
ncbi:CCA tRNA nucleotidyltransferase [Maritimibacter sp. DP1N21-5]|uniref:CCA tRNA nucleotidyltransferase n=1 Tax=Maritimibacter sp. DP1N21-5 TaxID=2836867 RepID=UPI001C4376E6|nr:CCA tRNA nucleotidyltransferase [Maritimibacter sp. DP1N21-5]MBV7410993.1 CCA tRNA nucleotidyltransferase [Maritimibacter sp. DP1N21-5]